MRSYCRSQNELNIKLLSKGKQVILLLFKVVVVVVALLFYVHGKHLRSCRDGQLT